MGSDTFIESKQVEKELSKILEYAHFKNSRILSRFLTYVVNQKLQGNEQFIKEYVIGTQVLNKKPDFNPQMDAIVRIHAGRLRKLLDKYYSQNGKNDPIRIYIPSGGYVPVFVKANLSKDKAATTVKDSGGISPDSIPKIAVIPNIPNHPSERVKVICSTLCRDLSIELSKFQELNVISNYSILMAQANHNGLEDLIAVLSPDYLITVHCIDVNNKLNLTIELNSVGKSQLIWGDTFIIDEYKNTKLYNYPNVVQKVISNACGFFGIIYQDIFSKKNIPEDYEYLYAIYWHNRFHRNFSPQAFQEAYKAINLGLVKNPDNSLLNSIKAELQLNLTSMDINVNGISVNDGLKLAMNAVNLDRNNQHAWQMVAWAYILKHNTNQAQNSIEKCYLINPNNSTYYGTLGFGYVCIDEYEKGWQLLSKAIQTPYYYWVANVGLCLYHLKKHHFEEALHWARSIKKPHFLWDPLLRLCCCGHLNEMDDVETTKSELLNLSPDFIARETYIIDTFIVDKKLQKIILKGLQKAGIPAD